MKIGKRIVTVLLLVAMLASLMMIASCGIFRSKVERKLTKLGDAKNYTMVYTTDSYEETVMVDFKHLKVCISYLGADNYTDTTYYWFEEEKGYFYRACVDMYGSITKDMITQSEFFDILCSYVETASAAKFASHIKDYEKVDGAFVYENTDSDGWWYKKTYRIDVTGTLIYEYESSSYSKAVSRYYDINKTKFDVPKDVRKAKI